MEQETSKIRERDTWMTSFSGMLEAFLLTKDLDKEQVLHLIFFICSTELVTPTLWDLIRINFKNVPIRVGIFTYSFPILL